jgi:hypothetical protein
VAKSEHNIGKRLNKEWGVNANHALYRENGTWYHNLRHFPGALFDVNGYIIFRTEADYLQCEHLQIGKQLSVPHGISTIPGYIRVIQGDIPTKELEKSDVYSVSSEDIQLAEDELAVFAGNPQSRKGQGFAVSAEYRMLIEKEAMEIAVEYLLDEYLLDGDWEIFDVSAKESFDLLCRRKDGLQELYVEVKGTASDGKEIILTPNEVKHARDNYPNTALVIISNLKVSSDSSGKLRVEGGKIQMLSPWQPEQESLTPIGFKYSIKTR